MARQKRRAYALFGTSSPLVEAKTTEIITTEQSFSETSEQDHRRFPETVTLQTDKEAVLKVAYAHKDDKAYTKEKKSTAVATVHKLDDIVPYDISDEEEAALWDIEIDRLLAAVNSSTDNTAETLDEFPEPPVESSFDSLSSLADQLLINLHVCRVDNGTVLFELAHEGHDETAYQNSYKILTERQRQEADSKNNANASGNGEKPAAPEAGKTSGGSGPTDMAQYCALVDLATSVCCRIAVASFEDKDWHRLAVASLAKYSAKLKVLAMDESRFTQRSISMASRSRQYKMMLEGVGDRLRKMKERSDEWKMGNKKKKKNKDDSSNADGDNDGAKDKDDNGDDDDDEEGDEYYNLAMDAGFGYPGIPMDYGQYGGPLGVPMMGVGLGMGMGMGGGDYRGGKGGMGGPGRPHMQRVPMGAARGGLPPAHGKHSLYSSARLKELEAFTKKEKKDDDAGYFGYMALINEWTSSTLLYLFQQLKGNFVSDLPSDVFDLCSTLYEAGTIDCIVPILLHQDRAAELSGTNTMAMIQYSYMGYWLAYEAANNFQSARSQPRASVKPARGGAASSSITIRIELNHATTALGGYSQEATDDSLHSALDFSKSYIECHPQNLSQVLSVMIPILCTAPDFNATLSSSISGLRKLFAIDVQEHLLPKPPRFTGVVSLRTSAFEAKDLSCLPQSDFRSLSLSILAEQDRQSTLALKHMPTQTWQRTSADHRQQQVRDVRERQLRLAKDASQWVIEGAAIRVDCAGYVYTVMAICGTIAVGGLMLGIFLGTFVQDSIALKGVDPFGFTSYSWIIAAFILLIAKSTRVHDWPWRDFLLRRVTCRSLSELQAVTGADEQDLITYLITMEYENVLCTSGPHNSIFARRQGSGSPGFSIDVKPQLRTLLASGLIFVKVLMRKEPTLVCLDFRAGGGKEGRSGTRHRDNLSSGDIHCRYPPGRGDRVQDLVLNQQPRHHDFMFNNYWDRVLGIYSDWDRMVR